MKVSTCFSDAPADSSPEVLAVTPGVDPSLALLQQGPCLVVVIFTLADASFTMKISVQRGANALAPYGCVSLLDNGSPQTLIRLDVLDSTLSVGQYPSRASGNALLVPGVVLANLLLCKHRRAPA